MIGENTHLSQTVESFEALAFTHEGVAPIRIIVINSFAVEVDTLGRSRKAFQSLRDDVDTRLLEAGYNLHKLNVEL